MQTTLQLYTVGDRELWYAQSKDDSWSLPLLVEWRQEKEGGDQYALIIPALSLYSSQLLLLRAMFQLHDFLKDGSRWLVKRSICESVLYKAKGITPEYYYKWSDVSCPPIPQSFNILKVGVSQSESEVLDKTLHPFVQHVIKESRLQSSVVNIVWKTICKEAPDWLLTQHKPIDFGFFRLVAFPFRHNWKEIVSFKCRKWNLRSIFSTKEYKHDLERLGLPAVLCSPHNISMSKTKPHYGYTLEALPSSSFDQLVEEYEMDMVSCGKKTYAAHFEHTVEKLYEHMVEALRNYTKKVSAPFAKVSLSGETGNVSFLPVGGGTIKVHGVDVRQLPVHIVPPDSSFSVIAGSSDPNLVQAQVKSLPEVSDIQQAPDDMRQLGESNVLDKPQ